MMFTGIVQTMGTIRSVAFSGSGGRLSVDAGSLAGQVDVGGSVAVNGVCLTVTGIDVPVLCFDVVDETLTCSNLGSLGVGDRVNLELSLRVGDRVEGHFVLGHVDTTCRITSIRDQACGRRMCLELTDPQHRSCVVPKSSVALDGISLTVARTSGDGFEVALIPTTLGHTTIGEKQVGEVMNLETDILVKTVVAQLREGRYEDADRRLGDALRRSGFDY